MRKVVCMGQQAGKTIRSNYVRLLVIRERAVDIQGFNNLRDSITSVKVYI